VTARQAGTVTITSGTKNITIAAPAPAPALGTQFEVAVRRDRVHLSRASSQAAGAGVNSVSGRVSGIEYQGTWLKISIEDACSEGFVANVPDDKFFADPLKIGDPVIARWDAEQLHYLVARSGKRSAASAAASASPAVAAEG